MPPCFAVSLGRVEYMRAWELQKALHQRVAEGALPGLVLLLEHPHVYTLGRRGKASDILATTEQLARMGVEVHQTDRGGEATYHGPGQLVCYPIVDLRDWGGGPLRYVRALEDALVRTVAGFGIRGECSGMPTGVWVGDAKIAAIGVKVSRGVTMHGFALNVDPDLSYFDYIVPCGMPGGHVTSMTLELGAEVDVQDVLAAVARHLGLALGRDIAWATLEELGQVPASAR